MMDVHDRYLRGISDLLQALEPADEDYLTVLTLQGRLAQAISEIRQYGPTDSARAEVARVTTELDRISLDKLRQSFCSLCGIPEEPSAQPKILENLPPRPFFVGRQRELRLLHEYLSPEERVALISVDGIGGIGKTTLVQEIAHQLVEERSFQAVIWATAKRYSLGASGIVEEQPDFTSLNQLLGIIARVLHRPPSEAKPGLIRQALSDIRSLVVVDNFETVQDNKRTFEFLRKLPGNSKALVTNRHRPAAQIRSGELVLPLKGLEKRDAFELLRNAGRTIPPPLSTADESLLETIYERTHGNPLAMEWLVAQIERGQAVQRILQRLGQPKANDLYRFIFEDSCSNLSENAKKALWAIAAIDNPTVESQVCYVAAMSPGEYERVVDELIGTSLVVFDHLIGRYSILDMTREYVIALMGRELEEWSQRAIEWETQVRFDQLDETAQEAFQLLVRSDKPVPLPTLATWLGGIGANVLDHLVTSLREAGLATLDEALQMITLAPQVRDSWQAELAGSGAIAQGTGAVATGHGAMIVVDVAVSGDFVGADKIIIVQSSRIEDYLRYLVQSQTRISLLAIDPSVVEPSRTLHLSDIFVAPYSSQQKLPSLSRETDRESVSILEAIAPDRRVVILGDPGSGKTTFLKYLVGAVARQRLGEAKELPSEITGFPLLVRAIDYASVSPEEMPLPFGEFLARHLASLGFSDLIDYVKGQLAAGECIILIDGLDELASERQRRRIVTQIEDFSLQYPSNRIIITSRIVSLQDVSLFSAEWARYVIAPFGEEQIDRFISAWYRWLAKTGMVDVATAEGKAKSLSYALRQHRQLGELAANPLLLTVIATLHTSRGRLPEDRVTLYSETSDLLFARWELTKAPGMSLLERLDIPGLKMSDLQAALAEVAFRIQANGETTIDKSALVKTVAPYLASDWNKAILLADYMSERAGLLVERAVDGYSFVHLTLQEFFAARYLSSQVDYLRVSIQLLNEDFDMWREIYLQSILYLAQSHRTSMALEAIQVLCPPSQWDPHLSEDIDLRKLILAGQAIAEIGLLRIERTEAGKQIVDSVRANLVQLIRSGRLSARERAMAGDILAEVGDPRPGFSSTLVGDLLVPDIAWCEIPAGPFLMGSSEARDANAYDNEKPQHRIELPPYRVGLYPVTNAQYRLFVEGGGYEDSRYWMEEGWVWRKENGIVAPEFWDEPIWNNPNHPVVGISWHEAMAFASWLTVQLEMPVRLPTEAEWEKAARGSDGRIYPWGDAWDPERANAQDTGIGQTSAVGIFPAGASPYGFLDMSGNVWEWTSSLWSIRDNRPDFGYPYDPSDGREDLGTDGKRVIRGGSWASSPAQTRVAYRGMADPRTRNHMIGFRVVVSPVHL